MVGLTKTSTTQEILIKVDSNTVTRYSVKEEKIDLGALQIEKVGILDSLKQPTDSELLIWAKTNYPAKDINRTFLEERLTLINTLLGVK